MNIPVGGALNALALPLALLFKRHHPSLFGPWFYLCFIDMVYVLLFSRFYNIKMLTGLMLRTLAVQVLEHIVHAKLIKNSKEKLNGFHCKLVLSATVPNVNIFHLHTSAYRVKSAYNATESN